MSPLDPAIMEHVCRAVEADVATAGSDYAVSMTDPSPDAEITVRFFGGLSILPLRASDPEWLEELAYALAHLQDLIIEEGWAAWPPCPSHAHPMDVRTADGDIEWFCPASGEHRAFLGELRPGT